MQVGNGIFTNSVVNADYYESQVTNSSDSHKEFMKVSFFLPVYNSSSFIDTILLWLFFNDFFLSIASFMKTYLGLKVESIFKTQG